MVLPLVKRPPIGDLWLRKQKSFSAAHQHRTRVRCQALWGRMPRIGCSKGWGQEMSSGNDVWAVLRNKWKRAKWRWGVDGTIVDSCWFWRGIWKGLEMKPERQGPSNREVSVEEMSLSPFTDNKWCLKRLDQMLMIWNPKFKSPVCNWVIEWTSSKLFNFWVPVSSSANYKQW